MILCVGGWEDRREEGADTALKTKTPHVNVGNDGKFDATLFNI
jgi:hypothetical protein